MRCPRAPLHETGDALLLGNDPVGAAAYQRRALADLGRWLVTIGEETTGMATVQRALALYEDLARRTPADAHVAIELTALRTWPGGQPGASAGEPRG